MKLTAEKVRTYEIGDYLGKTFTCDCGREHRVGLEKVVIGKGAVEKLPELLHAFGYHHVYMVADTNTYEAAGMKVEEILAGAGTGFVKHVYSRSGDLVPDEAAVGEFFIHMGKETDVILAVGAGVMNDLCKYMSFKLGIPYMVVATAPSMDGYASDGAALIIENLKTTLPVTVPKAIIGDVDILKKAPMEMIVAGYGDMVGKYSAINDWKLSNIINDEYYCSAVARMVADSLQKCIQTAAGLKKREDGAIKNLMEGLVLTGIAMSFSGNSRPASGSEHHISHFIEMMYLFAGKEAPLHGAKVGANTLVTNRLREMLAAKTPDLHEIEKKAAGFDENKWTGDVQRLFQQAAPGIIRLNQKEKINSMDERLVRVKKMIDQWDTIVATLKDVPSNAEIKSVLERAGAPVTLKELGIAKDIVREGIIYAKEVRARYTVLQLAWDLGVLEELAAEI